MINKSTTIEDLYKADEYGFYLIHRIAEGQFNSGGGTLSDLRKLFKLDPDFDVNIQTKTGLTPLHLACAAGKPYLADFLIESGADIEAQDKEGMTPIFSALSGSNKALDILCEKGVNINHKSKSGMIPIAYAIVLQKAGGVKTLCKYGFYDRRIEVSSRGLIGTVFDASPYIQASTLKSIVLDLLKANVEVNKKCPKTGRNEVNKLARYHSRRLTHNDINLATMKSLIRAGSDPWERCNEDKTAFHYLTEDDVIKLRPALRIFVKGKELSIATRIKTQLELQAFYFNQGKYSKHDIEELISKDIDGIPSLIEG